MRRLPCPEIDRNRLTPAWKCRSGRLLVRPPNYKQRKDDEYKGEINEATFTGDGCRVGSCSVLRGLVSSGLRSNRWHLGTQCREVEVQSRTSAKKRNADIRCCGPGH